ncbi:MAG TPA: hypothetical protein VFG96_09250 [Jiangellaceae bacterium]|nr:hypothetical protein [Jiangellaceae bacterium]
MRSGQVVFAAAPDVPAGPGLLGFLVVVALGLALVFLYRSLRKQLRRIDFDADATSDVDRMRPDGSADGDPDRP